MNTFTLQNLLSSLLQTPEDTNLELNFTFINPVQQSK